jgi:hypothetical protein
MSVQQPPWTPPPGQREDPVLKRYNFRQLTHGYMPIIRFSSASVLPPPCTPTNWEDLTYWVTEVKSCMADGLDLDGLHQTVVG